MAAAVDLSLTLLWVFAFAFIVAAQLRRRRRPRHVWGELNSSHVALAVRKTRGRFPW
jgi:hypothetical protein